MNPCRVKISPLYLTRPIILRLLNFNGIQYLPEFIAMAVSADAAAPELNPPPELPGTEAAPGFDLQ